MFDSCHVDDLDSVTMFIAACARVIGPFLEHRSRSCMGQGAAQTIIHNDV